MGGGKRNCGLEHELGGSGGEGWKCRFKGQSKTGEQKGEKADRNSRPKNVKKANRNRRQKKVKNKTGIHPSNVKCDAKNVNGEFCSFNTVSQLPSSYVKSA